jgi:drug/metabolite transporter (DMT)-like permease
VPSPTSVEAPAGAGTGAADDADREHAVGTVVLLTAGMAAFGTATPVSALVGDGLPVWLGSELRMLTAAAVLVPIALGRQRRTPSLFAALARTGVADRVALAAIAVVGTFGFSVFMLVGMQRAPGAIAAVVMATTPAVTAVGAVVFLGEQIGRSRVAAVGLAVGGVVIANLGASGRGGESVVTGSLLVFAAVCCEAAYSLLGKRLSSELDPVDIAAVAAVGAAVAFAPLAAFDLAGFDWSSPTPGQWLAVTWWGFGTMAAGSVLWFHGMRRVAASTASAFMGVMPITALVGSYVLLGERFEWIHLAGVGLVLTGLALVARSGATVH